jgi:drug/metabolite transporter (DMT)-like permease
MKTETKAYLALTIVCILWGTTYLAIKIGVDTIPPFLFCAIRQLAAGMLLWLYLPFLKKKISLQFSDVVKQIIPGVLMFVLGNAIIGWAEKYIPSGLAALIVSAMPLYITFINVLMGKGKDVNKQILTGLLFGCLGIVLIFKDNLGDLANSNYFWGIMASFAASLCWAVGTVYMKVNTFRTDSTVNSAIQFTSAGVVLLICSPFLDDYSLLSSATAESIWALVYLVFFGSIIPYICYLYAIKHLQVGLVSVYAYVNPFIAILLGMLILNEKVTWITALAFIATAGGVYFINKGHTVNNLRDKLATTKTEPVIVLETVDHKKAS